MNKIYFSLMFVIFMHSSYAGVEMQYPYFATEARTKLITNQYLNVKIGNSFQEVLAILPEPDEILDLYEPIKLNPKSIGKTYWYIIQRKSKSGSVIEKDEKLVRVSFDLNGKVTAIDKW